MSFVPNNVNNEQISLFDSFSGLTENHGQNHSQNYSLRLSFLP